MFARQLLVLLLICSTCFAQVDYTYTDPYLNITNLPSYIAASGQLAIQYFQFNIGPNFLNNTNNYKLEGRAAIPNGALDGCSPYPARTADGRSWNNTIVFVLRGTCVFIIKTKNVESAGALAILLVNCNPGPPSYCSPGRTLASGSAITYASVYKDCKVPGAFVAFGDGMPIINLLTSQPNYNVTVSITGTGPLIDPTGETRKALVTLANAIPTKPVDMMVGAMSTQAWALTNNDPCVSLDKPYQFICREGKFVIYETASRPAAGTLPKQINSLVDLEMINLYLSSVTGSIPDIRNLTNLKSLVLTNTVGISSMYSSIGTLQSLVVFAAYGCSFTALPDDFNLLQNIQMFMVGRNKLTTIPALNSKSLYWIDLSYNGIQSPLQNFSNSPLLNTINLSFNKYYSNNVLELFQNLPSLVSINLASNNLSGPLPLFTNCPSLQSIVLSDNQFTGEIPLSWNIPKHCSNNVSLLCKDDYTCGPNNYCQSLIRVDLSKNKITGPFKFTETSLVSLDLSDNLVNPLSSNWGANKLTLWSQIFPLLPPTIVNINLESNMLIGPWTQAGYQGLLNNLGRLILSKNFITSLPPDMWGQDTLPGVFTVLDVSYNNISGVIPQAKLKQSVEKIYLNGNPLLISGTSSFPSWISPALPMIQVTRFPFLCPTLLGNGGLILELVVDPSFYLYANCTCNRGYYGKPPNCLEIPAIIRVNEKQNFTDSVYGDDRLMTGVDISWVFNTQSISPIRAYIVQLQLFRQSFNQFSDIIEIYEGDESLTGQRISSIRGTDVDLTPNMPEFSANGIVVLSTSATLVFRSKKSTGLHFFANYTVSTKCPEKYLFEVGTNKCQLLFEIDKSIQAAIFAIISVFLCMLIAITVVIIKKRNSLIIRSSSFPFCLSMLVFMILLGIGSYFYAIYPDSGDYVCHIRPWLTAGPLVGILSALLVKVDRIRRIFTSNELVVQSITNAQLAKTMGLMLSAQFTLLIGFSASNMSEHVLKLGSGFTFGKLVFVCTSHDSANGADAFKAWLIIQLIYIALFLLVAVAIAWSVRKVPSAFNEAPSIASSLLSLVVLLIILIPLNYMVDDNPNALMLIRGLGQVLVTSVLALFFFGPKLYLILEGKDNDKALSSLGSSSSRSSSDDSSARSTVNIGNDQQFLLILTTIAKSIESFIAGSNDVSKLKDAKLNFSSSIQSPLKSELNAQINSIEDLILNHNVRKQNT